MRLRSLRVLLVSLLAGAGLGVTGGLIYALLGDKVIAHGIGAGLFIVGIISFGLGMLGATEPPEGWASRRKRAPVEPERRSVGGRLAGELPVEDVGSLDLFIWGLVVGGGLIAAALLAFTVAV